MHGCASWSRAPGLHCRGTVNIAANTAAGAPFVPSMLMVLASGSVAGERTDVHSATFREVRASKFVSLAGEADTHQPFCKA